MFTLKYRYNVNRHFNLLATYLLNELNAGSQVHTKVNELPFNAFFLVLLLLQNKHVMVEELLQFLICEVDAKLLQAVVLIIKQKQFLATDCYFFYLDSFRDIND